MPQPLAHVPQDVDNLRLPKDKRVVTRPVHRAERVWHDSCVTEGGLTTTLHCVLRSAHTGRARRARWGAAPPAHTAGHRARRRGWRDKPECGMHIEQNCGPNSGGARPFNIWERIMLPRSGHPFGTLLHNTAQTRMDTRQSKGVCERVRATRRRGGGAPLGNMIPCSLRPWMRLCPEYSTF